MPLTAPLSRILTGIFEKPPRCLGLSIISTFPGIIKFHVGGAGFDDSSFFGGGYRGYLWSSGVIGLSRAVVADYRLTEMPFLKGNNIAAGV